MVRGKKKSSSGLDPGGWLVTFGDMMTLLLTFFVLLLSMSTMDRFIIQQAFAVFQEDIAFMTYRGAARVPTRHKIVADVINKPWELLEQQNRIKDLLFPDDVLPPDINKSTLEENLLILERPEGVAIVLTDKILFPAGGWELSQSGKTLLMEISYVLMVMSAPINISGYTDNTPGGDVSNFELSNRRALSVLELFVSQNLNDHRFSVSGYGPLYPIADNNTATGRSKNRRVEILIKTGPGAQTYM